MAEAQHSIPEMKPVPKGGDWEPKVIGFLCNWCSYAGADLCGVSRYQYPTNVRPVRVMCSTRISLTLCWTYSRQAPTAFSWEDAI